MTGRIKPSATGILTRAKELGASGNPTPTELAIIEYLDAQRPDNEGKPDASPYRPKLGDAVRINLPTSQAHGRIAEFVKETRSGDAYPHEWCGAVLLDGDLTVFGPCLEAAGPKPDPYFTRPTDAELEAVGATFPDSQFADPAADVCFCGLSESQHTEATGHGFFRAVADDELPPVEAPPFVAHPGTQIRFPVVMRPLDALQTECSRLLRNNAELSHSVSDMVLQRDKLLAANREYSERFRSLESEVLDWKDEAKAWMDRTNDLRREQPTENRVTTETQHYGWALDLLAERLRAHIPEAELRAAMRYVVQTREQLCQGGYVPTPVEPIAQQSQPAPGPAQQEADTCLGQMHDGRMCILNAGHHEPCAYKSRGISEIERLQKERDDWKAKAERFERERDEHVGGNIVAKLTASEARVKFLESELGVERSRGDGYCLALEQREAENAKLQVHTETDHEMTTDPKPERCRCSHQKGDHRSSSLGGCLVCGCAKFAQAQQVEPRVTPEPNTMTKLKHTCANNGGLADMGHGPECLACDAATLEDILDWSKTHPAFARIIQALARSRGALAQPSPEWLNQLPKVQAHPTTRELVETVREELYGLGAASDDAGALALTELARRLESGER